MGISAISAGARKKGTTAAARLLPPGVQIKAYVVGQAHTRFTSGMAIASAAFVGVFVIALAMGYVLIPGLLLLVYLGHEMRPPRALVVTDQGFAVLARGLGTGQPKKLVAVLPLGPLYTKSPSGAVELQLGEDRITFKRSEFDLAARAAGTMAAGLHPNPGDHPPFGAGAADPQARDSSSQPGFY